jgi:branched-chain amino acid aminotransferase
MNLFFVHADGKVSTPSFDGTILRGITRDSIITLLKDRGHEVSERKITLDEVRKGFNSGEITEIFACGTAAVITPVGMLKSKVEQIGSPDAAPGKLTVSLREELTSIQYGRLEDKHGWMHRLSV